MESPLPDKRQILEQLSKILRSQIFRNANMLSNFLSFIVQEVLKENGMLLKQYSIAIHAFGRSDDFDPTVDPIVRIQASRLRRNLEQYYNEEGIDDEVIISVPKGTYMPQFTKVENRHQIKPSRVAQPFAKSNTIAVFPLKNLSAKSSHQHIVEGFSEELMLELSRYKHLQIIRLHSDVLEESTRNSIARFSLEGSIRFSADTFKISIGVMDNQSLQLLWSYQEKFNIENYSLIEIQEKVANVVAQRIAGMNGILVEKLRAESNWEKLQSPSAYSTYLYFYKYLKDPNPDRANELVEKMTQIVEKEPDFAPGWSVLCCLYTDAFVFTQEQDLLHKAISYGNKAVDIQPNNQSCQVNYAYALCANNQLEKAKQHCEIGLALNPSSVYYAGAIGWLYCLMDKTDLGYQLIQSSIKVDFQYPKWFHIGTFLYFLKKKDYNKALIEANKFDKQIYLSSLIKLVAYYKLKQYKQALIYLEEIQQLKPDFFNKPIAYIKSLIKAEFAVQEIHESLVSVSNYSLEDASK